MSSRPPALPAASPSCAPPGCADPSDSPIPDGAAPHSGTVSQCTDAAARCPWPTSTLPRSYRPSLPPPHPSPVDWLNSTLPQSAAVVLGRFFNLRFSGYQSRRHPSYPVTRALPTDNVLAGSISPNTSLSNSVDSISLRCAPLASASTMLANASLFRARIWSSTSSMVPLHLNRCTWTTRSCPRRTTLSRAWAFAEGPHHSLMKTTWLASVSVNPSPPTLLEHMRSPTSSRSSTRPGEGSSRTANGSRKYSAGYPTRSWRTSSTRMPGVTRDGRTPRSNWTPPCGG